MECFPIGADEHQKAEKKLYFHRIFPDFEHGDSNQ